jgi:tRNA threonylcarbamoyl adenosine modification protein YjeE
MKTIPLPTEADTVRFANALSAHLRKGQVLALYGPLGSGKTFFTRELCRALGCLDLVNSPTFVIRNEYEGPLLVVHYDLYRLTDPLEVEGLGMEEDYERGITAIEWPELAEWTLPPDTLRLRFSYRDEGRQVVIDAPETLLEALSGA